MLLCHSHCDLDLYPIEPKIDREHLLSMTNVCMKFEKTGPKQTLVFDWTRLYMTNGWMDRRTDRCKAIYPLFFEGRHKKAKCYKVTYLSMLFSRSSSIFSSIMVHLNCLQASITSSVKTNIFAIILILSLICHFETVPNSKKLRTTNEM